MFQHILINEINGSRHKNNSMISFLEFSVIVLHFNTNILNMEYSKINFNVMVLPMNQPSICETIHINKLIN